ncbi:DNA repair protein RecO [Ideonella sp. BN130291]|uniref:DNA repair protein RecO n=1 Tax=Ideonella sp. BN130291 TaxID=3112940 RepID=UPI002E256146|nr:DNA repair protein RecO [Ideonella sp. BN130291]
MSRRAAQAQAAYVLHRYDWSETSLILDLFTRDLGRVTVAAKGAKRPYSQLRPVLLPFQRLNVSFGRSTGEDAAEVQTLRQAEWAGGAPMLSGASLFSGFYLNELLMKLLARHDAHAQLFDAYADSLPALATGGDVEQAGLRAFELVLLRELGLLPDLSTTTLGGNELDPERLYALRPEVGVALLRDPDDPGCSGAAFTALQAALQHGSIPALQARCLPVLPVLRPQLRSLLHYHLGSPQLRTRQVMLDVQRLLD